MPYFSVFEVVSSRLWAIFDFCPFTAYALHDRLCLCPLLFRTTTSLEIEFIAKPYKSPLPNLKSFCLEFLKHLFIIEPNFGEEYLDPLLQLIRHNGCCMLPHAPFVESSLECAACDFYTVFVKEVLYELVDFQVFVVEAGEFVSVPVKVDFRASD